MSILSMVLTILMHLAMLFAFAVPFEWSLVGLAVAGFVLRMWAITAGYHRYFSHRAYKTSRAFQFVLGTLGTMAMQNGPLWWASWHRRHHKYSDTEQDPHSPTQRGFYYSHIGWFLDGSHDYPSLDNVKDLSRFAELRFLDKYKWIPLIAYAVGTYAIAGTGGLVWGFVISSVVGLHITACINSLAHVWGTRRYETEDTSRNNFILAILTLGEGWHNNHHYDMLAARQGRVWWEIDISYYSLWCLEKLGIIWDVRKPRKVRTGSRDSARAAAASEAPAAESSKLANVI